MKNKITWSGNGAYKKHGRQEFGIHLVPFLCSLSDYGQWFEMTFIPGTEGTLTWSQFAFTWLANFHYVLHKKFWNIHLYTTSRNTNEYDVDVPIDFSLTTWPYRHRRTKIKRVFYVSRCHVSLSVPILRNWLYMAHLPPAIIFMVIYNLRTLSKKGCGNIWWAIKSFLFTVLFNFRMNGGYAHFRFIKYLAFSLYIYLGNGM